MTLAADCASAGRLFHQTPDIPQLVSGFGLTLNPKPLNPKPLNPKPLNSKPLNPKPLNPKP